MRTHINLNLGTERVGALRGINREQKDAVKQLLESNRLLSRYFQAATELRLSGEVTDV